VLLVANKAEGRAATSSILDAYTLGLGDPVGVSAEHGEGVADLMSEIAERLPPEAACAADAADDDRPLKLAIVGRPNAGKSTLINRLLGQERMITGPEPGLTRDAVATILSDDQGRAVELVDTAGMRRRSRIDARLERLSVADARRAVRFAEAVILVSDALLPLERQDLTIANLVADEGRLTRALVARHDELDVRADDRAVGVEQTEVCANVVTAHHDAALRAINRRIESLRPLNGLEREECERDGDDQAKASRLPPG